MDLTEELEVWKIVARIEAIALQFDLLINIRVKTWSETMKMKLNKNTE